MDDRTHSAVERAKEKYGLEMALREEQELIIQHLLNRSDVFGLLPTDSIFFAVLSRKCQL